MVKPCTALGETVYLSNFEVLLAPSKVMPLRQDYGQLLLQGLFFLSTMPFLHPTSVILILANEDLV